MFFGCFFVTLQLFSKWLMKNIHIFIYIIASCLLCQCGSCNDDDDKGSDYPSKETFAVIDSCMSFMNIDSDKAHRLLDSLADARLMTRQRCDYFHAMVIFGGENNNDSALMICDRILDEGRFGDDKFLEEEICVLASNITSASQRYVETLKYAKRGIALCHGNELMRGDEATLMARVGAAEQGLGRTEQARDTYDRALILLKPNESFGDLIALISLKRKQGYLHSDAGEYDKVIEINQDILDLVDGFDKDPSFVANRPETMKAHGTATHDFAEFYRCQIYANIARAYRNKIEKGLSANPKADVDSVRDYIEKWSQTSGAQSPDNLACVINELYFVGKKTEFRNAIPKVEEFYRSDSLVGDYVDFLTLLADDAASNSNLKASNGFLHRALAVSDSIRQKEMMRELSQQMSINMVQEQQLARQDAENELSRHRILIILESIILVILLIAGVVILRLQRRNRQNELIIKSTQHDLSESKEEIKVLEQKLEGTKTEKSQSNTQLLYDRMERAMTEKKLYLNPDLSIETFAEAVNSSRAVVSSCINSVSAKPFRQWLAEYRLSLFKRMLEENPEESVDVLMMSCGYKEQSTFRRQFKATYGMSPGKFRKVLLEKAGGEENNSEEKV